MVPGAVEQAVPGVKKEVVPRVEKQTALPFFWLTFIASAPAFVSVHRQHARWEWALTRPQPPSPLGNVGVKVILSMAVFHTILIV